MPWRPGPNSIGDVGAQEDVGRAKEFVTGVDPPGEVMDPPGDTSLIEDQPEVVRLLVVGRHREDGDVRVLEAPSTR